MREQWKYVTLLYIWGGGNPASAEISWLFLYASYLNTKHNNNPGMTWNKMNQIWLETDNYYIVIKSITISSTIRACGILALTRALRIEQKSSFLAVFLKSGVNVANYLKNCCSCGPPKHNFFKYFSTPPSDFEKMSITNDVCLLLGADELTSPCYSGNKQKWV